jgi:hypothetical protein
MFGTIVEKIQAVLSRSFLLGNFFPVLIFATLNLAIAWLGLAGFAPWFRANWPTDITGASVVLGFFLVGLAVLAFVLAPLIPVFRRFMEGERLPDGIRSDGINHYVMLAEQLETKRDGAARDFDYFDVWRTQAEELLGQARNAPNAHRDISERSTFEKAKEACGTLTAEITSCALSKDEAREDDSGTYSSRLPSRTSVRKAVDGLAAALKRYPMQPGSTNDENPIYEETDRMQRQLIEELQQAKEDAGRAYKRAESEYRRRFIQGTPPTSLAIERAEIERYPEIAYAVDFNFIWPRLRMILPKDATIASAVDTASAQLDFAVLMTSLSALTAIVWLPVLAALGVSSVAYVAVGLLGPGFIVLFYRLTRETQRALGEVMITAIDGLRLELLRALRQPLPTSLTAEQKVWRQVQESLYCGLGDELRYRHPKA